MCGNNECVGIKNLEENCNSKTIGKLIGNVEDPEICIEENIKVSLSETNDYYIPYNSDFNLFNLSKNQYATIEISPNYAILKDEGI